MGHTWFELEPGRKLTLPLGLLLGYPIFVGKSIRDIPKKKARGRPPTGGRREGLMVRLEPAQFDALDNWISRQKEPNLSRPEAMRRLVELGLTVKVPAKPVSKPGRRRRARELAITAIEKIIDPSAPPEERAQRRQRLTKGPPEFREARVDQPRAPNPKARA